MSIIQKDGVVDRVASIMEKLITSPTGGVHAENFGKAFDTIFNAFMDGHRKVAELNASVADVQTRTEAPTSAPSMADANVSEASSGRPTASRTTATASRRVTVKSPVVSETVAQAPKAADIGPDVPTDDEIRIAEDMIREQGSARAALAKLGKGKRGRKSGLQKVIEQRAAEEARAEGDNSAEAIARAITNTPKTVVAAAEPAPEVYKFAHISRTPYMDPMKAIESDGIICLIDGEKRTMMSRYLKSEHKMTPEEYRFHFSLPDDYPMTATGYREEKRRLASVQGLGKRATEEVAAPAPAKASGRNASGRAAAKSSAKNAPAAAQATNRKSRQRAA